MYVCMYVCMFVCAYVCANVVNCALVCSDVGFWLPFFSWVRSFGELGGLDILLKLLESCSVR